MIAHEQIVNKSPCIKLCYVNIVYRRRGFSGMQIRRFMSWLAENKTDREWVSEK